MRGSVRCATTILVFSNIISQLVLIETFNKGCVIDNALQSLNNDNGYKKCYRHEATRV